MNSTVSETDLQLWVVAWAVLGAVVLFRHLRGSTGVGLIFSYVLSLAALHLFAPTLYLLPWGDSQNLELTFEGLRQSVFAMAGLALGAEVAAYLSRRRVEPEGGATEDSGQIVSPRVVNLYLASGALMYVMLFSFAGRLPTIRALIVTGATMMVVGVGLKCWNAWQQGRQGELWLWLAATTAFPVVTVLTQGYLGYGFAAMVTVFGFFVSFTRLKWKVLVIAVVFAYAGLSVYVTYMRDRAEIREAVWYGASTSERVARVQSTLAVFEWFDWSNEEHINRVNVRLNQDFYVGAAVRYLRGGYIEFAKGATFWEAAIAIVPRALWPDKPVSAGSGDLVATYTGIRFAYGTSVGVGQVLECYVNFGEAGVVVGFFLIGAFLVTADRSARAHLNRGDSSGFLLWYLPGLSMLQVGGSLTEVTATGAASFLLAILFVQLTRAMHLHDRPVVVPPHVEATS